MKGGLYTFIETDAMDECEGVERMKKYSLLCPYNLEKSYYTSVICTMLLN